jgi:hypothetical protein
MTRTLTSDDAFAVATRNRKGMRVDQTRTEEGRHGFELGTVQRVSVDRRTFEVEAGGTHALYVTRLS